MQLSEIREQVRVRMGIPNADQAITDTVLNLLINASLRRCSAKFDWPWLESTATFTSVADDPVIPEPADGIRKMRWVRESTRSIVYTNYRNYPDFVGYTGRPTRYTEDGGQFVLLPTPDGAYDYEYGYVADNDSVLALDTDEPLMPDNAIDMLVSDVCILVSRRIRDREMEKVYYSEHLNTVRNLIDDIVETYEGITPRRTRDGFGR